MPETVRESEGGEGVPANAMGTSSSVAGAGGIDTFDPLLGHAKRREKKKLRDVLKRREPK